ncbi:MAG: transglycosylase SLT domain-containing protein [Firmicutes bacterium]|nr:transglycosylase SLT domain-containing protein [Bacillota bacterium]
MAVLQAWRWRRLLPYALAAAMFALMASLFVPAMVVLSIGHYVFGLGGSQSVVATCAESVCGQMPGPQTPAWSGAGAQAVAVTWLPLETQVVDYYCARQQPCVDVAFVQAVMMQESGGDPVAVSASGALGLMQVEPSHFSAGQNPLDPLTNLMAGVGYLDSLDAMFHGDLPLVAAGYNAGPGAPEQWVSMYGTSDWSVLSQEPVVESWGANQGITTAQYVDDVMAYYGEFSAMGAAGAPPSAGTPS